jgi:hypothetical protein
MSWTTQGYLFGHPETDYGNGDPDPAIDLRNDEVPTGIHELSIYYGCSGAEFFRGTFEGNARQTETVLQRVHMLTVYAYKYGGVCRLEDHISHMVFIEESDKRTWFFDGFEQPRDWKSEVERLLPARLRPQVAKYVRPPDPHP